MLVLSQYMAMVAFSLYMLKAGLLSHFQAIIHLHKTLAYIVCTVHIIQAHFPKSKV